MTIKHVRCNAGENVVTACTREFGDDYEVIVNGMGKKDPQAPGMVGTITVRPGESFAVVPREAKTRPS